MKALHQLPASPTHPRPPRWARRLVLLALVLGALPAAAQRHRHRHEAAAPTPPPPALPILPILADTVQQVVALPAVPPDTLAAQPLPLPAVDSVRLVWLQTPATLYEVVGDRMGCLETAAPHQFNEAVLTFVRLFTERQRGYTQRVLEREQFYFPIFEKYLAQYNLPLELKYLSVVESALIPTAKSPVGAAGLWQFMPPTANDLRLRRDEWVDERMHPDKATEAACKHLRYLYGEFHDWELVLAAYNWGTGNVRRVMRRTGKKSFWDLYPHLPAETRNYVPTFTAIMYAMKYAPEHNLHDPALRYQTYEPLDTLGVRGQALDLRRLSRALGYADSLALARFNPEVRQGGLPAGYRPYVLRYPSAAREHLGDVDRATLLAYCQPTSDLPQPLPPRPVRLAGAGPWPTTEALAAARAPRPEQPARAPRYRRVYYPVRRGQTVAGLAEKFDVSPAQLRRWNELPKHAATLRPGRELLVLVPLPPAAAPTVAAAAPVRLPARPAAATDSIAQVLAAANLRYAREAQAAAQREAAQAQALRRVQQQQAARVAAQQQAIFRAAALAKAATREKSRQAAALAARPEPADSPEPLAATDSVAAPERQRQVKVLAANAPLEAAATPARVALPPAPPVELYTVRGGDNLTKLARARGYSVAQVQAWNQLATETVVAGQQLRFGGPEPGAVATRPTPRARPEPNLSTHTVQPGDTLYNISRRFRVSVQELRRLNHLKSDAVKLGQKLVVQVG